MRQGAYPACVDTYFFSSTPNVPSRWLVPFTGFALGAKAPYGQQYHRGFSKCVGWATLPLRQSGASSFKSSIHLRRGVAILSQLSGLLGGITMHMQPLCRGERKKVPSH